MMENTGIEALQGNPNAPWINQAIQTYGVAGNYFGVTHPSQPNYVAATAGTTAGVPDDNDVNGEPAEHRRPARGEAPHLEGVHAEPLALHDEARSRVRQPALRAEAQPVRLLHGRPVQPGSDGEHRRPEPVRRGPGQQGRQGRAGLLVDQPRPVQRHARARGDSVGPVRLLEHPAAHLRRRHVPVHVRRQDHGVEGVERRLDDHRHLGRERLHRLGPVRLRRHSGLLRRRSGRAATC